MKFDCLDRYMDSITASKHISGVGVTVYRGGKHLHTYTAGYANIAEKKKFAPDTIINLYSCTKVSTAAAGAKLVSEGKLKLDVPASEYLPELADVTVRTSDGGSKKAENTMTVRHIFSMTGGFSYDIAPEERKKFMDAHGGKPTTREVAREIASQPLLFEPGTHFKYSFCLDVLGAIIPEHGDRLVVFIDELDRCKPDFAVRFLERIKHYLMLDDRVIFVFSINREQLEETIKHLYGYGFDSHRYLDRFFDLNIELPAADVDKFCSYIDENSKSGGDHAFFTYYKNMTEYFNMSLREMTKYFSAMNILYITSYHNERKTCMQGIL